MSIKINLLGHAKTKATGGGGGGGEGPSPLIIIGVLLIAGALGNAWYYNRLKTEAAELTKKIEAEDLENRRLAQVKAKFDEAEKQKEIFQKRKDVIEQLKSNQLGPVNLLSMIGDTVNSTDAVWLNSMKDNGGDVSIEGTALSADAVANLITNLKKTGYFKNVEIKETVQDESAKDVQAFTFSLVCEKQLDKKS